MLKWKEKNILLQQQYAQSKINCIKKILKIIKTPQSYLNDDMSELTETAAELMQKAILINALENQIFEFRSNIAYLSPKLEIKQSELPESNIRKLEKYLMFQQKKELKRLEQKLSKTKDQETKLKLELNPSMNIQPKTQVPEGIRQIFAQELKSKSTLELDRLMLTYAGTPKKNQLYEEHQKENMDILKYLQ